MKLSIIIVSFNTKELLRKCLESLYREIDWDDKNMEIIVVDNGSSDGTIENVKRQTSNVKCLTLIENNDNLGFSKANNQGIRTAKGEYILLLNSDTQATPGSLKSLLSFAKNHLEAGIIGSKLLNPDGTVQPSVYHFPTIRRAIKEYFLGEKGAYEKYAPTGEKFSEVEALVGAAMFIPKAVFEKVGFLDERYFMYFEDFDFCRRVKSAGLKIYYLPESRIFHHHGASGKKLGGQALEFLVKSSKIYHGRLKYYLLTLVIRLSQNRLIRLFNR